jgi:hypothetical protein
MTEDRFAWPDTVPLIFAGLSMLSLSIFLYSWVFICDAGNVYNQVWNSADHYLLPPLIIILSWLTIGSEILVTWHRDSVLITRSFLAFSVIYSIAVSIIMLIFFWSFFVVY